MKEQRRAWQAGNRSEFAVFTFANAPRMDETDVMAYPTDSPAMPMAARAIDAGMLDGSLLTLLFAQSGPSPFSLIHVWFKPNYLLARHWHDVDCLYYVIAGSLRMGARELRAGDGFYVPADTRYGYQAGADGVELLEIRTASSFGMQMDASEKRWSEVLDNVAENHAAWTTMDIPPSVAATVQPH